MAGLWWGVFAVLVRTRASTCTDLKVTSLRESAMFSCVAGTLTFGVVGVVEEQNDSSAATPRFTTSLSEDHSLELKRTRLGAAGSH
jgi:hypothetical protein